MEPSSMHILRERLKRIVQRKSPQNTTVCGYFHIRRGDTIDECDTSLEVFQDFMECSLNGTESTGKHITFLIGSDEKDDAYRQNVLKLSNRFSHVSMLDADKLAAQVIKEAANNGLLDKELVNNFYLYELQRVLRADFGFSSIFLDKARSECQKCVPLMKYYPAAWKK
jgi:hypothetical protein